jgi:hypothetical protein
MSFFWPIFRGSDLDNNIAICYNNYNTKQYSQGQVMKGREGSYRREVVNCVLGKEQG